MKLNFKTISILTLCVLGIIVLLQNTEVVTVRFLFWQISMSQIILLPLILIIGLIIGFFVGKKSWDW